MRRILWAAGTTLAMACTAALPAAGQPAPDQLAPGQAAEPATPAPTTPLRYYVELIHTAPVPASVLKRLKPLTTLQEVEAFLNANSIGYTKRRGGLSTEHLDAQVVARIEKLPPYEVFVFRRPNNEGLIIGVILGRQ